MIASSFRVLVSSANCNGSLGTPRNSAATELVATAISKYLASGAAGAAAVTDPPVMKRYPVVVATRSGFTIVSQCFHTGRFTSAAVRHVCDVSSTTYEV